MYLVEHSLLCAGILACLDGYMNIAMEQTEVGPHASTTASRMPCVSQHAARLPIAPKSCLQLGACTCTSLMWLFTVEACMMVRAQLGNHAHASSLRWLFTVEACVVVHAHPGNHEICGPHLHGACSAAHCMRACYLNCVHASFPPSLLMHASYFATRFAI